MLKTKLIVYIIVAFICCFAVETQAQHLTPSQMREKKQKEDAQQQDSLSGDKKLTPSELRAKGKSTKAGKAIFGDDDPQFKVTDIPAKWSKESAVVIYQKQNYSYLRNNKVVEVDESVRKRVKLLDKAAVDEFSEFYYLGSGAGSDVGVKIIKSDGRTVDVSTSGAVEVEKDIPFFYRAYYYYVDKYYKLAIPDLQVGDIIDYYYLNHKDIEYNTVEYSFSPFVFTLNSTYPIMAQKFQFTVDRGFFIDFNSYNGAPSLKEGEAGTDLHGRKRALIKTYELVDTDRERLSKDIWNYKFRTSPVVKFQVLYESNGNPNPSAFIGEMGEAKSSVSPEEIQKLIGRNVVDELGSDYASQIVDYLNRKMRGETNPQKIAQAAFYYFRYLILNYYYVAPQPSYGRNYTGLSEKREDLISVNEYKFASVMLQVFKKKNIDAQVVVAVPRDVGTLENLLLRKELDLFVRVKKGKTELFLFPFNNHSTFDCSDEDLEGVEAWAFHPEKNGHVLNYEKVNVPVSDYKQNTCSLSFDVSFDAQMENVNMVRNSTYSGLFKSGNLMTTAIYGYDYLKDEQKKYDLKYKGGMPEHGNKSRLSEQKRKAGAEKEDKEKDQKDALKKRVEEDFEVASYDEFELTNPGREEDSPDLQFKETFKVKGMINKAGKNYIFELGKIIGHQIELKEENMTRDNDIYCSFSRAINNEITVTLPDGYKAEGLSDLTFNIDNECCSFTSTAKQEGNKIIVKTQKIYKNNFDKKDTWPKYVSALEAAYKFTQKKVILKKA